MALAAKLESKGLHRRAWRVRWNLDGEQPARMPPPRDTSDDCGRPAVAIEPGVVRSMAESLGLSIWAISRRIGVSHNTVRGWFRNGGITPENFMKLQELCK
jgi:hypothetical protein